MQLETLSFQADTGWSRPFPPLDSEATLVLTFGDPRFGESPQPLAELQQAYPQSHHLGCSTSGEIHGASIREGSLSVAVIKFERSRLRSAFSHVAAATESHHAGRDIAEQLFASDLKAVFVLSDGLLVNGSQLVRGINEILPTGVSVTGGLAGDGARFGKTWSLLHGVPHAGIVSAVGFYGESVRISHGSKGGWDIFGPERKVTRSSGNVLYELDGRPALQLYKDYLGDRAAGLPATGLLFPLALRTNADDKKQLVRTILAVDEANQSMTFAGDIPEGSLAQLMRANFDRLVEGASDAAIATRDRSKGDGEVLSIAISCVGRRLVLGERTEEEVEAVLDILPAGTRQIGFYSYGEISPYTAGTCDLHNQTMTLTTLGED
jgi:hypothetical protein